MWGWVTHDDAFRIPRFVKFSHSISWFANNVQMSVDTNEHNDAD